MRTRAALCVVMVALALAAVAVQTGPAATDPIVASATGSGHMVRPDGTFRSFSFSARKYADGSVDGQLQLNSRGFDVFVHIEIDCLRVVANTAYMSGHITHTSNPAEGEIGELNRAIVRDNGEGHGVIDQVSRIPANPGSADQRTCLAANEDLFPLRDVHRGNVQVR
jgi:hypothetical protein